MDFVAGIDLGGTKIYAVLADMDGRVCGEEKIPTRPEDGFAAVMERMARAVDDLLGRTGIDGGALKALAVGAPGPLNPRTGVIHHAPNLGWREQPLGEALASRLGGVPVAVENDANLAALGEYVYGAGQGVRDLVYITVSTGIGGGLILNGELYRGAAYAAGEVGHLPVADGPACRCGARGCLETVASGTAIARRARDKADAGCAPGILALAGGNPAGITAQTVTRAAENGDMIAQAILNEAAGYLGKGLAIIVNLLNPAMIILGGGVMQARRLFWDKMLEALKEAALDTALNGLKIVPAALGGRSGGMGAVALALKLHRKGGGRPGGP